MSKVTQLTKKQFEVIEDLFEGKLKENEILQKHKVSRAAYNKWLADDNFIGEFDKRIEVSHMRNAAHIARDISKALVNLVELSKGQGETARKACLDIIALQSHAAAQTQIQPKTNEQSEPPQSDLSPEAASRILAALAEEN